MADANNGSPWESTVLNVSKTVRQDQTVLILRPARRTEVYCPYSAMLQKHGMQLIEQAGTDSSGLAIDAGCRVGLLMLNHADDVAHLESCELLLNRGGMSWIGMIAPELVADVRVRECISAYLFNFLILPAHPDHTMLMLRHAWGMAFVRDSCSAPVHERSAKDADFMVVGKSEVMQCLFAQIRKVARTEASVLIIGASGTGKELAAMSVHRQSPRKHAPFIAVNCGSIAPQLLQSELFGYEKGAFTGAQQRKIGRIEAARGGTLFLDEIGDMPLDMQINLLRFLQEKRIVRVGGTEAVAVDVRVIAATHVDLAEAVAQGRFREDLYYRINVICISTPRLTEREADIDDLAQHYFTKFSTMHKHTVRGFSRAALTAMRNHTWPGNVRELINRIQRATVMAEGRFIQPEDLGFMNVPSNNKLLSLEDARATTDRVMIHRALSQARNQMSHAASLLGVSRMTLYRLIEKYNIRGHSISTPSAPYLDSFK
ncbi:sigma-54 interaction domain-containing protein [Noviherbaspirillum sedimenti]|uniref:Sigma-54-dependent Fis family transcriptional regulator n=1 Tax=Noviherbaspirillum sedimenti TaxID=2320865 RepID=A0A3A3G3A8_9BURK|nr:sigma-54 dependent transcriptional regulator [Noviherbaspirillum sedimenti]RJG02983.1 sigma-54-dependent Fis family transcriptional regulator [Noviherbaspirillum sedimenti]